jgi:hypothetical protein
MVVSGTRNRISNCQISGIGHLDIDDAASCSLTVTGDENYFVSNYIGLDTVLRTTSGSEVYITGATRNIFDGCIINSYTANTSFKAITWGASTAHSATWLIDCMFCAEQNRTGVAVPTGALLFGASGQVFMRGGGVYGYADVSTLANANILMLANWGLQTASNFPGIAQGVLPS